MRILFFRLFLALIFSFASPAFAQAPAPSAELPPAVKRKMQALALVYREATAAKEGTAERAKLLDEFLARSGEFVREQPDIATVWLLRATVALELGRAREGWEAGRAMIRLGLENSADAAVQQLLVQLERKNWLGEKPPAGPPASSAPVLSDGDRLELATLQRMTQAAPSQTSPAAIKAALAEVLKRSAGFVEKHPDHLPTWHLRARLALELNQRKAGAQAGKKLKEFGALTSADAKILATMAELNARDWLSEKILSAADSAALDAIPLVIPDLDLELRPIASGTFTMGSPPSEQGRNSGEGPQTAVTLRGFWLGKTEVTQGQWQAVMGNNPSVYKGDALPVENVAWEDVIEFCRKLTERERSAGRLPDGYRYTLPMEAQWEYACRAGTTTPHAGNLNAMAWYAMNSATTTRPVGTTHAVGTKQANAWGLHDMHGNVREWCLDWQGEYPGGNVSDPMNATSGSYRVHRGGSFHEDAGSCRSAMRVGYPPHIRIGSLGFRLALASSP